MYFDLAKIFKNQWFTPKLAYIKDSLLWAICRNTRGKRGLYEHVLE